MSVTTKDELKNYVLRQLGAPLVQVELDDTQLDDIVDSTIKEFSLFAFDGELEDTVALEIDGKGDYQLPVTVSSVIKVSDGTNAIANFGGNYGAGYVPDLWSEQFFSISSSVGGIISNIIQISATKSMLDTYMGDDIAYDFNPYKKILRVFEPQSGPILVHYTHEYVPDSVDYIFDQTWIKKMCTAQARLLQSTVTGKYDATLVGGTRINHENMRSLAEQEIQQLREDLQLQYAGPAPILIG